ncbi:MAG: hypothetical protein ACK46Y_12270 [Fluviicola sp.]
MDYEKKYPLTQFEGEYILARWTKGFGQFELIYKDRIIVQDKGGKRLQKGVVYSDPDLGKIEVKLSEKPIMMNIIVNDFHSPINSMHPRIVIKSMSTFFYILTALGFVSSAFDAMIYKELGIVSIIIDFYLLATFLIYLISAITISRGAKYAFFMGFTNFCVSFLLESFVLLTGLVEGWLLWVFFVFRIIMLIFLLTNIKLALSHLKHLKFSYNAGDESNLLDSRF